MTFDPATDHAPSVSPDGSQIFFFSYSSGSPTLYRMSIAGENLKPLIDDPHIVDVVPECSPDGNWVIYVSTPSGPETLFKVSAEGGDAVQLTDKASRYPAISPDGKLIACLYFGESGDSAGRLAVIPIEGGQPVRTFDIPQTAAVWRGIRWLPDGSALAYSDTQSRIWSQPLDGGSARQLIDFGSDQIFNFAWSRDGKQLAFSRGTVISDVAIISNFK